MERTPASLAHGGGSSPSWSCGRAQVRGDLQEGAGPALHPDELLELLLFPSLLQASLGQIATDEGYQEEEGDLKGDDVARREGLPVVGYGGIHQGEGDGGKDAGAAALENGVVDDEEGQEDEEGALHPGKI